MAQEYKKPLPVIDADYKPYWDAAKRHELVQYRCQICGDFSPIHYPITGCPKHGRSKMEWTKVSGKGNVYTFVVFRMLFDPAFKDEIPYNVAIIELAEGSLLMSNIVQCKNEDIKVGMPVEVVFEDVSEEVSLPKFKPAP